MRALLFGFRVGYALARGRGRGEFCTCDTMREALEVGALTRVKLTPDHSVPVAVEPKQQTLSVMKFCPFCGRVIREALITAELMSIPLDLL